MPLLCINKQEERYISFTRKVAMIMALLGGIRITSFVRLNSSICLANRQCHHKIGKQCSKDLFTIKEVILGKSGKLTLTQ